MALPNDAIFLNQHGRPFWGRLLLVLWSLASWGIPAAIAGEQVSLQLKWRHQFQFAGYYAAVAKGYYEKAGLSVTLHEAQPGDDPMGEVLNGHAQYGVGTSNLILLRSQGHPVVVLAVIYQHSPFVLLASKTSGVEDIHDLVDKQIMMEPDAAELQAYFQSEGVNPRRLKHLPHSFDVQDIISGKAAAMSAYSTDEPFDMIARGAEYSVFTPRAGGIDFYGDNLFTTEQEIREHPERVAAFRAASLQGWIYAMAHPEEIVDLILEKYNRGKNRDKLLFEARETAKLVHPELIEVGYINPGRWQNIAHVYETMSMMNKGVSLKGFIYETDSSFNWTPFYWVGGIVLGIITLTSASSLLTWKLNRKLRREVIARQHAENQAREESAAKTHFYAILAHEVRAPMSGILASLWLYDQTPVTEEKRDIVKIAESSTKKLLHMVDHILDHARIESGHMTLDPSSITIPEFVREVCGLFQAAAVAKGIRLEHDIAPGAPESMRTDLVRLQQILYNLLANAIKFTSSGWVRLSVAAGESAAGAACIVFRVSDSGPGIAAENLSSIFEPYVQADVQTASRHGGSGLGLSIASRLAHMLDGSIQVASTPGEGSHFTVTLPTGMGA
ncbi:phospho-acceptor domain-containing protein [Prosthecobacter fusiformis]|uniref:histidine kinase n=1 Tax=Prosthecobacter fusiformis TaxID=48464 RepID=A0A4R7SPP5_9BACT|nr:ABC transporter substrate-binding protein [Prosthecobacter fusiformis]TDU80884.1 phospho-acceptor domain-containing protein [Prosthecobacter fusiformis]